MNLENRVNKCYNELNENDLYIWQYILHHKKECQKLSIQELAKRCNVSHTSILRFVKKLDLEGYSEFKIYLKWENEEVDKFDRGIIEQTRNEYQEIMDYMIKEDLEAILKMIDEANRVFVYGSGAVQRHMAQEMKREFLYAKKIFHPVGTGDEIDTCLHAVKKDDIFIIISLSGNNDVAVNLAKALKGLHIKTIGVCRKGPSLLKQYVDESLCFSTSSYASGLGDLKYGSSGHFFVLSSFLFLRYLEYLDDKKDALD